VKLNQIVGNRKPTVADWLSLADGYAVDSDYTLESVAPEGVKCRVCWDTRRCAECLGRYPDRCPEDCGDGTCPFCR